VSAVKANVDKDSGELDEECFIVATVTGEDEEGTPVVLHDMCPITVRDVRPESIALAQESVSLAVGDVPHRLEWEVLPANATFKEVSFSSSNPSTVTVSGDGLLTPVTYGRATVTVSSKYDPSVNTTCAVEVAPSVSERIVLASDSVVMGIGEVRHLGITSAPSYPRFTYESADAAIAEVDESGYITAKARGEVAVTISCTNSAGDVVTAVCRIRVIRYVERIEVEPGELNLSHPSGTYALVASVYPDDADVKELSWESSDGSMAEVDASGVMTAKGYGHATITARATDGSGASASMQAYIAVPVSGIEVTPSLRGHVLWLDGAQRDSVTLTAEVFSPNATFRRVNWSASSDAVRVSPAPGGAACTVTAQRPSESVVVTATDERGDRSASVTLKVRRKPSAVSISLVPKDGYADGDFMQMVNTAAHSFKLKATVSPSDAYPLPVTWTGSEPSAVSVDADGNVTTAAGAPAGTYTVKAAVEGAGVSAVKRIRLDQGVRQILVSNLSGPANHVELGCIARLSIDVYPKNAYNKDLDISVTHPLDTYSPYEPLELINTRFDKAASILYVAGDCASLWAGGKPSVITVKTKDGSGIVATYNMWVVFGED
jgi:uncharacterized protein YjdB